MESSGTPPVPDAAVLRRARGKFAAMAATYALGTFNDNFFKQAVLLLAVSAGMPKMQGYALVIFTAPFLVLAAPAGWLADRYPKRYVVIGAKVLELLAMLAGAAGICYGHWWLIFAMLAIMGSQAAVFSPALNGSIPELYPAEYVVRCNGILRMLVTMAILSGVALAGVALDQDQKGTGFGGLPLGRLWVGGVVICVALLGVLSSLGVPRRSAAGPGTTFPWDGPVRTLRDLWGTRQDPLLAITIAAAVFIWFAGSLEVLIINPLGVKQYALGATHTSLLIAAELVGLACGGLLSARLTRGKRWYRILLPAGFGMGSLMVAMALVPWLPQGWQVSALYALLALIGACGGMFMIPVESFMQIRPAADRKGAIIAASNFVIFAGILISGLVSNLLNSLCQPTTSFGIVGLLALAVTAWLATAFKRIDARENG